MGASMSLHEFCMNADRYARQYRQRYGQALFNYLLDVRPDLAEKVRGTDSDPFYAYTENDARAKRFMEFLGVVWDS
jgi:hypothetical protein